MQCQIHITDKQSTFDVWTPNCAYMHAFVVGLCSVNVHINAHIPECITYSWLHGTLVFVWRSFPCPMLNL